MKILNFLRWLWEQSSVDAKILTILLFLIGILVPGCMIFGIKALLIFFIAIVAVLSLVLIYAVYRSIKEQWQKYNESLEIERQQIVDKLRGDKPYVDNEVLKGLMARRRSP